MVKKKDNILVVHNYYQIPGGEDAVVSNEIKMLKDNGHKVILYKRSNSELKMMNKLKKLALPLTTIFNPKTYIDIRKIIKKENIDIVHVHNTLGLISPAVYYAAVSMKIPVVQTMHNFRLLCPGATLYRSGAICEECLEKGMSCALKHNCYRGNKIQTLACVISTKTNQILGIYKRICYIALTEFNKRKLLNMKQIDSDRIYIKPNFTYEINIKKSVKEYYLFIGRIEEIKGVRLILDAFEKLKTKRIVFAGTGTDLEKYKKYVRDRELDNISFIGFIDKEHLGNIISKAKAVIVASQWFETFGMVVVEAFSAHTPVIVGNIGNVCNLVDDGVNGVKFDYNSSDSLVNAILRFEQSNVEELGDEAYKKYLEEFSVKRNYDILNRIYNDIKRV